jgi:excisionase family DNA binding protein
VAEAAAELGASEAYVRRLLLRERLYGTKLGSVWVIYPDDLEAFKRLRRPPGRPRKAIASANKASIARIASERVNAGTGRLLRQRGSGVVNHRRAQTRQK